MSSAYGGTVLGEQINDSVKIYICTDIYGAVAGVCTISYFAIWYTFKNDDAYSVYTAGLNRKFSLYCKKIFYSNLNCHL